VVHTCRDLDGIIRSDIQLVCKAGAAKVGVILGLNVPVPGVHGLRHRSAIHPHVLRRLLLRLALKCVPLLDVDLNDTGSI